MPVPTGSSRRSFLAQAGMAATATLVPASRAGWAAQLGMRQEAAQPVRANIPPEVAEIVAQTIGIDTHNHIDVPLAARELPGPDIDLAGEMKRSGLSAICMTFATDYQPGDAYARFLTALSAMDRQLQQNGMRRSLSPADVRAAHRDHQPTVIQAVEGGHFLQGRVERVAEAYGRGLRLFGLLHDSDASVPLGDVYTNPPRFGGLTAFGADVIRECNRLGILIDLAHADLHTTEAALKTTTRPLLISHTGLDTQRGNDPQMFEMMRPRLIGREQATMVAQAGGLIGVWTHLSDTPLQYAQNIRAMTDVIGVDHVCLGTDTKLTTPSARPAGPPPGRPAGAPPGRAEQQPPQARKGGGGPHIGERTNQAWAGETLGFYYAVVDAMLRTGFSRNEIGQIGGGNFLRVFGEAVGT